MDKREDLKLQISQILDQLKDADHYLKNARNLGIFDIFAGGTITSLFKIKNVNNAEAKLEGLEYDLKNLKDQLDELDLKTSQDLNISSLLKFLDIFADRGLIDIFTQMKISDARGNIEELRDQLEDLYFRL